MRFQKPFGYILNGYVVTSVDLSSKSHAKSFLNSCSWRSECYWRGIYTVRDVIGEGAIRHLQVDIYVRSHSSGDKFLSVEIFFLNCSLLPRWGSFSNRFIRYVATLILLHTMSEIKRKTVNDV